MNTETKHTPEAPCQWNNTEAVAWQSGYEAGQDDMAKEIAQLRAERSDLLADISAAHGLIAPLGNQATPSVLAIREATSILRNLIAKHSKV